MALKPSEVRAEHARLLGKLRKHQEKVSLWQLKLRTLERLCSHPKERPSSDYSGGRGMYCPDCGRDTC